MIELLMQLSSALSLPISTQHFSSTHEHRTTQNNALRTHGTSSISASTVRILRTHDRGSFFTLCDAQNTVRRCCCCCCCCQIFECGPSLPREIFDVKKYVLLLLLQRREKKIQKSSFFVGINGWRGEKKNRSGNFRQCNNATVQIKFYLNQSRIFFSRLIQ